MPFEMLYRVNEVGILGSLVLLLVASTEIGFRIGRRFLSAVDDKARPQIGTLQAAALGLLALASLHSIYAFHGPCRVRTWRGREAEPSSRHVGSPSYCVGGVPHSGPGSATTGTGQGKSAKHDRSSEQPQETRGGTESGNGPAA
jgi:hypothetical protein